MVSWHGSIPRRASATHAGHLATERLFVAQSFMVATAGRAERERERLRKLEVKRKEQRWLNPSAAKLQREHEYMDWVVTRPEQFGDEPRNDISFEIFLAERSFAKEKERLRLVAERRKRERQEKRRLADAAKPARPAAVCRAAQPKTETAKPSAAEAVPRPPQPRGRPVDPNSKRQRRLAEKKKLDEEDRKLNEMLRAMTRAERKVWDEEQYELSVSRELQRRLRGY